jgi:hypothetical protein
LDSGLPGFRRNSTCSAVLSVHRRASHSSPTGLSPTPVAPSSSVRLNHWFLTRLRACRPVSMAVNPRQASAAACATCLVWAPPGSLTTTTGILSLPRGTEMFQFPRFPPPCLCVQHGVIWYHPDGVAPFGYPRIIAYPRLPEAFRGLVTSFFGSRCQGIHHVLFARIHLLSQFNRTSTAQRTHHLVIVTTHQHTHTTAPGVPGQSSLQRPALSSVACADLPCTPTTVSRRSVHSLDLHCRLPLPSVSPHQRNQTTQMRVPRCSCLTRLRVCSLVKVYTAQ